MCVVWCPCLCSWLWPLTQTSLIPNLPDYPVLSLSQAWSSRGQQLLVPAAWQQMTPVGPPPSHPPPPPPSSLTNDTAAGPQRIGDWGWVTNCLKLPDLRCLMLMLEQVSAFCSRHEQTLMKHSTVHWKWQQSVEVNLSVHSIILEVKLRLNFFNLRLQRA